MAENSTKESDIASTFMLACLIIVASVAALSIAVVTPAQARWNGSGANWHGPAIGSWHGGWHHHHGGGNAWPWVGGALLGLGVAGALLATPYAYAPYAPPPIYGYAYPPPYYPYIPPPPPAYGYYSWRPYGY